MKRLLQIGLGLVSFYLFFSLVGVFYKPKIEIPANLKGQYAEVRGLKIRYYQEGKGPDLLMMHGCPGSVEDFEPIIHALAQRYRVTAFDRPGHGYSSGEGNEFTLDYNARIANGLIEKLQLKDVLVIGHSYGSGVALSMAIQNSPGIKGYVLLAAPGYKPVSLDWDTYILGAPGFGTGFGMCTIPILGPKLIAAGVHRGFTPNWDVLSPETIATRVQIWSQPKVLVTRSKELLKIEKNLDDNSHHYKTISAKIYIVQGKEDTITKAAWKLHGDIPNSDLTVYEGVGHYSQFAKPKEVIGVIDRAEKEIDGFHPRDSQTKL